MVTCIGVNLRRVVRWLVVLTSLLAGFVAGAAAESVAIITDVAGKAAFLSGPSTGAVTILSEVAADARLQLEGGARLVAIYLESGDEYTFTGPAQIQFRASEPQVISGAKPQRRANPLHKGGKDVTIKPVSVTQAAFVMRSGRPTARIKLLTLSGTRTLDSALEFRWQALEAGVRYHFEITDETGKSLHEAEIQGTSFRLPDSVQLREGVDYTWELSARTPDGRRYVSAGDFSIATADLRATVELLRPVENAPVSERVAFAAWLEQMELRDEARKYWRPLAQERPEDAKLKALAAE